MNKQEFLNQLKIKLQRLPEKETEERLTFYSEMIDDRMEEGRTEEQAVSEIGSIDEIASQIIADIPLLKIAKEKLKPNRRLKAWEIVLLAVGSPIWLSLLISAFAVMISLYVVLWSIVISLWAVFASLLGCSFGGLISGTVFALLSSPHAGIALIGASLACAGIAIFLFFGCREATKGTAKLAKVIVLGIKKAFIRKEDTLCD